MCLRARTGSCWVRKEGFLDNPGGRRGWAEGLVPAIPLPSCATLLVSLNVILIFQVL